MELLLEMAFLFVKVKEIQNMAKRLFTYTTFPNLFHFKLEPVNLTDTF